jgi:ankyrin repeat protein
MKQVLTLKPDVNVQNSMGYPALFYVKSLDSLQLLIEAGADLSLKDKAGKTALWHVDTEELAKC